MPRSCWSTAAGLAAERGVELEWREANADALPFGDNEFDVVMSCIGVMFAPFHQQSAGELVRVCRPGGTDRADQLDARGPYRSAVRDHEAVRSAPAARCAAAAAVGSTRTTSVRCSATGSPTSSTERRTLTVDHFADGAAFRDYFKTVYGPTISAYRNIEGDRGPGRRAGRRHRTGRGRLPATARTPWSGSTCC